MANQNPLATSAAASGGAVVRPETGQLLLEGILRESGVLAQAQAVGSARVTSSQKVTYPLYRGRPEAYAVSEGASISTTGAELDENTITVQKFATITTATTEMLEDQNTGADLMSVISQDVDAALADIIEQHALGLNAGSTISSVFDFALTGAGNSVDLGSTGDRLRVAASEAYQKVRTAGYRPTGVVWNLGAEAELRDARQSVETTNPVYGPGANPFYVPNVTSSSHLADLDASAGSVVGILGDFRQLQVLMRSDVRLATTTSGVVGGEEAFTKDLTHFRWTTRCGVGAAYSDAFCAIVIPGGESGGGESGGGESGGGESGGGES